MTWKKLFKAFGVGVWALWLNHIVECISNVTKSSHLDFSSIIGTIIIGIIVITMMGFGILFSIKFYENEWNEKKSSIEEMPR